jgi:hypothetical protein
VSGAVTDPRALIELLPNWQELGAPLQQPVTRDDVLMLSESGAKRVPDAFVPRVLHNEGNFVVSLSDVVKWMAQQAEALGVEIFPGFAAAEVGITTTARSRAWPPATKASPRTANPPPTSCSAWSCTAATPSSPKAHAAISASS